MTNTTFIASLAYKAAVLRLLLPEASFVSERLRLPPPHPIQVNDVQKAYISSPEMLRPGATIVTTNVLFIFDFYDSGKLYAVRNKLHHDERFDLYPEWARTPSLVNSTGAHQLATQWLAAIDVDVKALEQKYEHQVEQAYYWDPPGTTNKTMLPIFNVAWGTNYPNEYPAQVRILGTTKELMELHLSEPSLSRRPPLVITNAMELNNTDPPVVKHLQRPIEQTQTNSTGQRMPPPILSPGVETLPKPRM